MSRFNRPDKVSWYSPSLAGSQRETFHTLDAGGLRKKQVVPCIDVEVVFFVCLFFAAFTMEQDIPDYDMDSEDERWMEERGCSEGGVKAEQQQLSRLQFEEMIDRLEKNSGQTVVTLKEAESLLERHDERIIAVYDYWLNKRLRTVTSPTLQHHISLTTSFLTNHPVLAHCQWRP